MEVESQPKWTGVLAGWPSKNGILHKKLDMRRVKMLDATIMFIVWGDQGMCADILRRHACVESARRALVLPSASSLSPSSSSLSASALS
jgi:hypothetical protein